PSPPQTSTLSLHDALPIFSRRPEMARLSRSIELSRRRVVITGLGIVSPVGNDVPTAWANLVAGRSGISAISRFDASAFPTRIAGDRKSTRLNSSHVKISYA